MSVMMPNKKLKYVLEMWLLTQLFHVNLKNWKSNSNLRTTGFSKLMKIMIAVNRKIYD